MRLFFLGFIALILAVPARAQDAAQADLILPPGLESPDAPFYRGARVKLGEDIVPVVEGRLPAGTLAQYQPDLNAVVVSDASDVSENRKGQALMDVVSTMEISTIATAAGQEKTDAAE